jgi:hypothetical protein
MSVQTRPFGHPKARKFIKGSTIPFQSLVVKGDTLEESASLSLVAEALEGRGPLAKTLKAEAKNLVAKFEKANPDFKFSPFKRDRNGVAKKVEEAPKAPKKAAKESKKPSKATSKPKPKSSPKTDAAEVAVA